jgi:hypothetical protein
MAEPNKERIKEILASNLDPADEMKLPLNPSCRSSRHSSVHSSDRSWESTPWKLRGYRLHTIPLLSLTLQLSAHQEWEGNKPGMALHPCPSLDTSSSSMCCLLACWLDGA